MRRAILAVGFLIAGVVAAYGGWPSSGRVYPHPATVTYVTTAQTTTSGSSETFSSISIGTATSDRVVVVGIESGYGSAGGQTISGVTIGGNAATKIIQATGGSGQSEIGAIYALAVPSGTTATIIISYSGTMSRGAVVIWTMTGTSGGFSPVATNSATSGTATNSISLATGAYGAVFALAGGNGSSSITFSWSGLGSVDASGQYSGTTGNGYSGGHTSSAIGTQSISVTQSSINNSRSVLVGASF